MVEDVHTLAAVTVLIPRKGIVPVVSSYAIFVVYSPRWFSGHFLGSRDDQGGDLAAPMAFAATPLGSR